MRFGNISEAITSEIAVKQLLRDARNIGGVHSFRDYRTCEVLTHDYDMVGAGGIPRGSLLLATILEPEGSGPEDSGMPDFQDEEILLLRVEGPAPLYNESHLLELRTEAMRASLGQSTTGSAADVLTRNEASFVGLHTTVLGTFYTDDYPDADGGRVATLCFSQDIETFHSISQYRVYKPMGAGLQTIASFPVITPEEIHDGHGEANPPPRSRLGSLRYSATRRRQLRDQAATAHVNINISDFIGNKSALFGMTRMGKSNTMKVIATETLAYSLQQEECIGQLILDPSGEYSHVTVEGGIGANIIDIGSHVSRYHFGEADAENNLHSIRFNFFEPDRIQLVHGMLANVANEFSDNVANQIKSILELDYEDPVPNSDNFYSARTRARRRRSLLYAILVQAGLTVPAGNHLIPCSQPILHELHCIQDGINPLEDGANPPTIYESSNDIDGLPNGFALVPFDQLPQFFIQLYQTHTAANEYHAAHHDDDDYEEWHIHSQGNSGSYFDPAHGLSDLMRVLDPGHWAGWRYFRGASQYHTVSQQSDPVDEIVGRLNAGELVIVTSFGIPPEVLILFSHRLVLSILNNAKQCLRLGNIPPSLQVFIDEAHNVVGKNSAESSGEAMDPFAALAKEGGKFNIGMIYATQEVHMIDDEILSNTANWVVTHLNSKKEIKVLSDYYDFAAFGDTLLNNEVVGYAICRTRSCPYTLPVQIELFSEDHVNRIQSLITQSDTNQGN